MLILGLSGSFGTGKSFVASVFRSLGAKVIDADKVAHDVIKKGSAAYLKIVRKFGKDLLDKGGNIDRRRLADKVFTNRSNVASLNRIVHPEVIRAIEKKLKKCTGKGVVIIDAPLLIEAGLTGLVDILVIVKCPLEKQIQRCRAKFRIEREEILKRIKNQLSLKKKLLMADFIIDNSRTKSTTRKQVIRLWKEAVWK